MEGIVSYQLSKEEKSLIINQHLKNLEYSKYNLRISLLELNSDANTKTEHIENLQSQVALITKKQDTLIEELNLLEDEENNE
jgi:hypothetical protein